MLPGLRPPIRPTPFRRLACLFALVPALAQAQHAAPDDVRFQVPAAKPGLEDARQSLRRMEIPPGWTGTVWAAEPDLQHPVAFDVADDGRVFVAESLRAWRGVQDIRPLPEWLDEDIASRSVEDRLAMMRRHLGEAGMRPYFLNTERIRLLVDSAGRGSADRSRVFAEGFSTPLDGVASSVLARGNEVWFANIPDVWWLRDADGDGAADERRSLSHGHGVRISMLGHDLHGLAWGPDGRIYVSVGDRGSRVFHGGRWHGNPECGSVFRFEPDGSGFEVFAEGLRNPQELVFDDRGHLFTGDNSANTGDESRWVHVVEGGDSGWRIGWQWTGNRRFDGAGWKGGADGPGALAPWNTESMWHPRTNGQPAYIVPPVANLSAGPCGVALYPGTGLDASWDGTFVLSDFRGSSSLSGFWKFKLEPNGAGFRLVEPSHFLWGVNATDGTWGPDGSFWVLDWTDGWEPEGRGRIHRFAPTNAPDARRVRETAELLKAGFGKVPTDALLERLGHRNRRVRDGAQAELVRRWDREPKLGMSLRKMAASGIRAESHPDLPRLHALWALGHALRIRPESADRAESLAFLRARLADPLKDLRLHSARILGDLRDAASREALESALGDVEPSVRSEAALALARIGDSRSGPALVGFLRSNADRDALLRHAGALALSRCLDGPRLTALAKDPSPAVRLAAVVALRRQEHGGLSVFLADAEPAVATEAARAIHDLPVPSALADLAVRLRGPMTDWAFARRAINAALRIGTVEAARDLARLAAEEERPTEQRVEALTALGAWTSRSGRDRVTGLWRPLPFERDAAPAREVVLGAWNVLAGSKDPAVLEELLRTAGSLDLRESAGRISTFALDRSRPLPVRRTAVQSLVRWETPVLGTTLDALLEDPEERLRAEALKWSTQSGGDGAVARLEKVLARGGLREKQAAVAALGRLPDSAARSRLERMGEDLLAGRLAPELAADVLDAAAAAGGSLTNLPARHLTARPQGDPLAPWDWALAGGDFEAGEAVYARKASVECVRCHAMNGSGGQVGPDLTAIGTRRDARYLLQAVVQPNATIAPGFETVLLTRKDGETVSGIVARETADALELRQADGSVVAVPKSNVAARDRGLSAMPEGFGEILGRRELRDLVAYLSGLK